MTLRSTDYALLAQDSYKTPVINEPIKLDGVTYKAIDYMDDPKTGFQATAYKNVATNEIVIAYRGTEFDREPKQDGMVDAGMALDGVNAQTADSIAFTKRVMDRATVDANHHHYPLNVTVTGHSLGGTLAEINAYKFGLHGETFNAFGAAGLVQGVPAGGTQVIDNVRATDVVSSASAHFGLVRVFAVPQDIQALSHAGYSDSRLVDALMPQSPILGKIQGDAHGVDNFVPQSKMLGHSIMTPQNQVYAREHQNMIEAYRDDIKTARSVAFIEYQINKPVILATAVGAETAIEDARIAVKEAAHAYDVGKEKAVEGLHATERAAQYAEHETVKGYRASVDAASRGIEATVHAVQSVEHETVKKYDATVDVTSRGMEATVHGTQYVAHETVKGYDATVDVSSRGIEATAHAAEHVAKDVSQSTQAGAAAVGEAYAQRRPDSWSAHPPLLNDAAHPDHRLFQQAYDGVKKVDAEHGRVPDHHSLNLAGALTVEAKARGLRQVDVVALSGDGANAFAVEKDGRIGSTSFAKVDTMQAIHTPIEQSSQQMVQVNQQLQQQAQLQQIQQQAAQVNPQQASPGMAR